MVYKKVICWNLFISILKFTSSRANIKQYIPLSVPSCRNLHYSPNIEWTTIWVASRKIIFSRYILREFTVSEYQPLYCGWRYVFVVIAEKRQRLRWVLYLSIPLQSLYTHALCLCVPGFFEQVCGFIGTQILGTLRSTTPPTRRRAFRTKKFLCWTKTKHKLWSQGPFSTALLLSTQR